MYTRVQGISFFPGWDSAFLYRVPTDSPQDRRDNPNAPDADSCDSDNSFCNSDPEIFECCSIFSKAAIQLSGFVTPPRVRADYPYFSPQNHLYSWFSAVKNGSGGTHDSLRPSHSMAGPGSHLT